MNDNIYIKFNYTYSYSHRSLLKKTTDCFIAGSFLNIGLVYTSSWWEFLQGFALPQCQRFFSWRPTSWLQHQSQGEGDMHGFYREPIGDNLTKQRIQIISEPNWPFY